MSGLGIILQLFLSICLLLVSLDFISSSHDNNKNGPIAKTVLGAYLGKFSKSRNGLQYESYLGIRFGRVKERFEIPQEISQKWDGVKHVNKYGPICAQIELLGKFIEDAEDDCLFLNIFTPSADNLKRPVMVYIHSGGFSFGSGRDYNGDYIVDENVVLVTFNYRLGILGFLNTQDGIVSGNMGLKDQVLALKWVQKYIENFGGDPERVTIVGCSAGGASVTYLTLSPMAKGLFSSGIAMSGTALNPWAFRENTVEEAQKVGKFLKCNTETMQKLVDCLKSVTITDLLKAQQSLSKWFIDPISPFPPSIELRNSKNSEVFLDKRPEDILKSGDFNSVPLILTMTKDEGLLYQTILRIDALKNEMNEEFERIAPITMYYENDAQLMGKHEVAKKIKEFYFKDRKIDVETSANFTNLYTDRWFLTGIYKSAMLYAKHSPVYLGQFEHSRDDFSTIEDLEINEILGVAHGDDLSYIFGDTNEPTSLRMTSNLRDESDINFSKKYVKTIASFITNGIPKVFLGNGKTKWSPVSKENIDSGKLKWLKIDSEPEVLSDIHRDRINFWEGLYKNKKDEL